MIYAEVEACGRVLRAWITVVEEGNPRLIGGSYATRVHVARAHGRAWVACYVLNDIASSFVVDRVYFAKELPGELASVDPEAEELVRVGSPWDAPQEVIG